MTEPRALQHDVLILRPGQEFKNLGESFQIFHVCTIYSMQIFTRQNSHGSLRERESTSQININSALKTVFWL